MTKKITRKLNGQPETVVVSDAKADAMISKGWTLYVDAPAEDAAPKKRGPKPKNSENN